MEEKFKFVITAQTEEFENTYIKKYSCSCGGKYQILLRNRIEDEDKIYNYVKTVCMSCNKPSEFHFDITERENKKKKDAAIEGEEGEKKSSPRRRRRMRTSGSLVNVAKKISDAFIPFDFVSSGEAAVEDFLKTIGDAPEEKRDKGDEISISRDYENLKFLYAQAMMKIRYYEEDKIKFFEKKLKEGEQEIKKLSDLVNNLKAELDKKETEVDDLKDLIVEKDEDIRNYKKLLEEEKQKEVKVGGWKKFLGGK